MKENMSFFNTDVFKANGKQLPGNLHLNEDDTICVEDIGDGNLNDVIRVTVKDKDGGIKGTVIIKHSLPYIKCLGEGYPLGAERIDLEYKALIKFHSLSPGSVPKPYLFDKENNSVYMEDLQDYEILRTMLMRGEFQLTTAVSIAKHLATIHSGTHVGHLGQEQLQQLDTEFENSNMISLTEQFIFTRPFNPEDKTNRCSSEVKERLNTVYGDADVLNTAKKMLDIFLHKKECLVHGDLHTGSIMANSEDARIMDIEFAFIGPSSFDLGLLIANYISSYYRNMSLDEGNGARRKVAYMMIDACKVTVSTYLNNLTVDIGSKEEYSSQLLSEMAGFAGCEIIRRLVGAAHNADLEDLHLAEQDCLGAGVRLLQASHRIHDIDRLMVIALMLA